MAEYKWRKVRLLGAGSYGSVNLACRVMKGGLKSTDHLAAIKSIDFDLPCVFLSLKEEGIFLKELNGQPNIVRCYGEDTSVENGRMIYNLLLEYANGGTLHDLIYNSCRGGVNMPEARIACYTSMLLRGLAAIHSRGIVHCDLKPANILVFTVSGCAIGIGRQLKIANFGLAHRVTEEEKVHADWDGKKNRNRGTLVYSSPESVAYGLHESCTDIWSLGCVVYEMMTGERIWKKLKDRRDLWDQIMSAPVEVPANKRRISEKGIDFLEKCLNRDRQKRWSAAELLDHPFIVNNLEAMKNSTSDQQFYHHHQEEITTENPFGSGKWVSKRHIFTFKETHDHQLQQQQQQQQQQKEEKKGFKDEYFYLPRDLVAML